MLKLKRQYFGLLLQRTDSLERPWSWEILKAGGERDDRGWNCWMTSLTRWHAFEQDSGVVDGQGSLACCSTWGRKESNTTEWLIWTELNIKKSWNCVQWKVRQKWCFQFNPKYCWIQDCCYFSRKDSPMWENWGSLLLIKPTQSGYSRQSIWLKLH